MSPHEKVLSQACVNVSDDKLWLRFRNSPLFNRHVNTLMKHYHYAIVPKKPAEPQEKALSLAEPHFPALNHQTSPQWQAREAKKNQPAISLYRDNASERKIP